MEKQKCFKCSKTLPLSEFYAHSQMGKKVVRKCKECNKLDVRENYHKNREQKIAYDKFRHRNSFSRIFSNRYAHIEMRCTGKNKVSIRYNGMKYLTKKCFIEWCYKKENMDRFVEIWNKWRDSNFERKLTPSIDRIDNTKGYTKNNIQWLSSINNVKKHYNKPLI